MLSVVVVVVAAAGAASAGREQDDGFRSAAIDGTLHYEAYLPSGYATSTQRYPVLYFLHGLPSGSSAYRDLGFVERALDRAGSPAILIAPQGARSGEPDPEYLDLGPGRRWETAITRELPRIVDRRFRTIASRRGRALIGLSAGGYGAMHLGLSHLGEYSVVESWSGYFHPTDPTGTRSRDLGTSSENAAANIHVQTVRVRSELRSLPTFIAFYVGRSDARFAAENRQLNQELTTARIPHVFRLYSGGHEQALWARYASSWLSLAVAHLAPAA